jgi:AcrR family transcriptional regulator
MKIQRDPDRTRQTLLDAAFKEIHLNGFQAASLNNILANTGLTKGALYYHFPTKLALGYAVLEELIQDAVHDLWIHRLENCGDPIGAIQDTLGSLRETMPLEEVQLGCPLNNLALEMSPMDEGFRQRVNRIYELWIKGLANALSRAQKKGKVAGWVMPQGVAVFIVASLAGCRSIAKNAQSREVLFACAENLSRYLETLRP